MQNEDDEEFVLRVNQLFVNGDIGRMTPVQLQKLNIISGLRDSKLQIKLLELPADATLADIDAARHTHTANIATSAKLGGAISEHRAQKVGTDSTQTCWKCGENGHLRFDCRAKDLYCAKCKSYGSHVTSTCRDNDRGRSSSRGRDNSRGRNASRGCDRQRTDSRNRIDSRGRIPGWTDRSDSRRQSNSRNDRHRARSVEHKETLGHEIVNRITTKGVDVDYVDTAADDREDDDGFTEGNFNENCYQMTELNDDNPDSIVEETDTDESIFNDITLADKFTEGNFMGDSDNNDENDETEMDADPAFGADDKTSLEEIKSTDKDIDDNVEYYWSDDDDETEDHCADDADSEIMISLMTTNRQDMSVILSESEARRQREEIFPSLCCSCREIVKYFPIREADTGMLFPTESDIVSQTDSDYFDRQKCDSQSRHEMSESARGN